MSEDIELLDIWAIIRMRPAMYIGDIGPSGLHLLVYELVHLGLDEFRAGFCKNISVTIYTDGSLSVEDNGRAPTHAETSAFLTAYTRPPGMLLQGRDLSTGFFFFGSFALLNVAALSTWLICEVRDGKQHWQTSCEAPIDKRPDFWQEIGACMPEETGLRIHFQHDPAIFGGTTWNNATLLRWLWEQVHLYPGLTITFTDEREGCEPQILCAPDGLRELLPWCLEDKTPVHSTIIAGSGAYQGVQVELALLFTREDPTWRIYGCGLPLKDGGAPLTGLRTGLARTLGKLARRTGISFQPEKASLGIAALVSVWTEQPVFSGPTRQKLANPEAEVAVARVIRNALITHASQHPAEIQAILAAL